MGGRLIYVASVESQDYSEKWPNDLLRSPTIRTYQRIHLVAAVSAADAPLAKVLAVVPQYVIPILAEP